jgi:dihydroorotate dehydrogenase electron transfer subunit
MKHPESRNTLHVEQAEVLDHIAFEGDQYYMRLHAPLTASQAQPGSFVHMQCDSELPMRRPMSIMRVDKNAGWIELLFKAHGIGTDRLAKRVVGEAIDLIGPIGVPFKIDQYKKYPLLIGGGVGIPPMVFLAEHIKNTAKDIKPFVIMGSEVPFPFSIKPSQIMIDGLPKGVIASMPLLEDWGIPSRLTSLQGYSGCYDGYVTDLANHWLDSLDKEILNEVEIFSCGPTSMLNAVSQMAHRYGLACQVSLEEYMACAVGGCAGCTVLVETKQGPGMKRVCVDGPVFEAASVFPPA